MFIHSSFTSTPHHNIQHEAQPCLFLTQKPSLFEILTSHNITGASEAKWRALLEKNGSSRLKKAQGWNMCFGRWVEKVYVLQWKHVDFFQAGNGVEKDISGAAPKKTTVNGFVCMNKLFLLGTCIVYTTVDTAYVVKKYQTSSGGSDSGSLLRQHTVDKC